MAALVLPEEAAFDLGEFTRFLCRQHDLGPKQWPRYVRTSTALPRTETFKVLKRQLSAEGTACPDPVHTVARP
jgi:fatty-acyl-CoA synthase